MQPEKTIIKMGKTLDKILAIAAILLIGVAVGYAWCWFALN